MISFDKHVSLAKEKAKMADVARSMGCFASMCDLAFKAVSKLFRPSLQKSAIKGFILRSMIRCWIG